MRYYYRFIISFCLIFSSGTYAFDFFVDALYWQATEEVDWALNNNLNPRQQEISYLTNTFNATPGFRVGVGHQGNWDTTLYYTQYYTSTHDTAVGSLTSTFLGAKSIEKKHEDFFFSSGTVEQTIHFNMFDWDLGKQFQVDQWLTLKPIVGIKGGWIDQFIMTNFTGSISTTEKSKNNFNGIGPKAGIESVFTVFNKNNLEINLIANFTSSYLWGIWSISDVLHDSLHDSYIVETPDRNVGALVFEGVLGAGLSYKQFSMKLCYEINDWFDQFQIFDDGTGEHNNDLILQGVTLGFAYRF